MIIYMKYYLRKGDIMGIISKEHIFLGQDLRTRDSVIKFIAKNAKQLDISNDFRETEKDLWKRENSFATSIDSILAVPHAKSESIKRPSILMITTKDIIPWGEEKVDLIISLLIPKENKDNIHLTLLSKLSAKLMDDDFVKFLKTEKNKEEICKVILKTIDAKED